MYVCYNMLQITSWCVNLSFFNKGSIGKNKYIFLQRMKTTLHEMVAHKALFSGFISNRNAQTRKS